ncbi:H-NS family histone-like protein [Aeromonas hydrophila]|uniref:H-NS family histone-like protein n=1 Tax=Aeromonas hydrophila TaxID=644 RepID=UPI00224E6F09|nr:H-NS family nucleoid-associated regulatory protein [Aeromonas hydrophila]MCX4117210.1 H-NS histone family protein [Aeromonas hydrophila]
MSDFLKVLLNVRSLRAALRELSVDQIDDALQKISLIYDERKDEDDKKKQQEAERIAKLKEFADLLELEGINPKELVSHMGLSDSTENATIKTKRPQRPAKYRYTDGLETKEWTGQGRMPKAIAEAINNGKALEDFLIAR